MCWQEKTKKFQNSVKKKKINNYNYFLRLTKANGRHKAKQKCFNTPAQDTA